MADNDKTCTANYNYNYFYHYNYDYNNNKSINNQRRSLKKYSELLGWRESFIKHIQ